jgi:hypothetical protein
VEAQCLVAERDLGAALINDDGLVVGMAMKGDAVARRAVLEE